MNIFYKICVILIIIGGINWGLIGLFSLTPWLGCWAAAQVCSPARYIPWLVSPRCAPFPACSAASRRRAGRNNAPRVFPLFRPSGAPRSQNAFSGGPSPRQRASAAVFCRSNFSESPSRAGFPVHIVRRALYRNPTFGI